MKMIHRGFSGTLNPEESERERASRVIARRAAAEGIVLLKNDNVLPLAEGQAVALYGGGARYTIKGGTGSGSVNNRSNVSVDEGLRNAGLKITTDAWLDDYDVQYREAFEAWKQHIYDLAGEGRDFDRFYRAHASNPMAMPEGAPITPESVTDNDTAIFVISRISGEGADRKAVKGDYYLSESEERSLASISAIYKKTIVILNVGGIIDTSFVDTYHISALVYLSQAGMEGGNALGDVLTGKVNPSGKLTDTWAINYSDYPSSATFSHNNGNIIEEKYTDGIYVGYRYFDSFSVNARYPFGFGLSYTSFQMEAGSAELLESSVKVSVKVTNTGSAAGKEVIQLYAACPSIRILKEQKRLVAFKKTHLLAPGETETVTMEFSTALLESYHTATAAYYLEQGNYILLYGNSSVDLSVMCNLTLDETVLTEQFTNICPLLDSLKEIKPNLAWMRSRVWQDRLLGVITRNNLPVLPMDNMKLTRTSAPAVSEPMSEIDKLAKEITEQLTLEQKATLVCGRPSSGDPEFIGNAAISVPGAAGETTSTLKESHNIAPIVLADGPAGVRIQQRYEEDPATGKIYVMDGYEKLENRFFGTEYLHEGSVYHYQFLSAIPIGTLLAQSFDLELLQEVGEMIGQEMEEFGITLWLAPGMNIHRNPLCGRNFEYYSEDPLVSGMMAAAITLGVQKVPGVGTTIKHYACNNQEENRRGVSSIVSERALREIYLKGFEIAVKASKPMSIMTSYNKINGVHTANSYDLCTTAARKEWGFTGAIMTDWTTTNADGGSSAAKCIAAGNDWVMPGMISDIKEIIGAVKKEEDISLDEKLLNDCVERILRIILASNAYEGAESYLKDKTLNPLMK
ncbi:MAG: glycoside hydrolase family 3 C-terminal domain-containing protein [Clostridiales bacterium]|nr:glycoside hydrolase family 3 C-terminal domain-containing protein [Candidatus Blautia equi]